MVELLVAVAFAVFGSFDPVLAADSIFRFARYLLDSLDSKRMKRIQTFSQIKWILL